jgi:hypothetical protein
MAESLFPLGMCVITANAMSHLQGEDIQRSLVRHSLGDWGEVCDEDRRENERALKAGLRLFSIYRDCNKRKFYIITESDRAVTTVLLPEDY